MAKSEQWVSMVHKDFQDREPARVLRSNFEKVWKEKGWQEVKEDDKPSTASTPSSSSSSSPTASGGSNDK